MIYLRNKVLSHGQNQILHRLNASKAFAVLSKRFSNSKKHKKQKQNSAFPSPKTDEKKPVKLKSKPESASLFQDRHQFTGDVSGHHSLQPSKQLPSHEHRRELRPAFFRILAGDHSRQFVDHGGFILLVNLEHSRVHTQTQQQPHHHMAHATPTSPEHNHCVLWHHFRHTSHILHSHSRVHGAVTRLNCRAWRSGGASAAGGRNPCPVRKCLVHGNNTDNRERTKRKRGERKRRERGKWPLGQRGGYIVGEIAKTLTSTAVTHSTTSQLLWVTYMHSPIGRRIPSSYVLPSMTSSSFDIPGHALLPRTSYPLSPSFLHCQIHRVRFKPILAYSVYYKFINILHQSQLNHIFH